MDKLQNAGATQCVKHPVCILTIGKNTNIFQNREMFGYSRKVRTDDFGKLTNGSLLRGQMGYHKHSRWMAESLENFSAGLSQIVVLFFIHGLNM